MSTQKVLHTSLTPYITFNIYWNSVRWHQAWGWVKKWPGGLIYLLIYRTFHSSWNCNMLDWQTVPGELYLFQGWGIEILAKTNIYKAFGEWQHHDHSAHRLENSQPIMPPSHYREFCLRTNTNWYLLRIAQHRIDSNYFVLVRCHFRISSQANTNVLKCSKHSYWPCESKPILLQRIASPNVVSIRVSSYWFVSHRCTFVSIRCTFAVWFAACLLWLSKLQYDAQRSHCRIGSHMFALARVSSY